MRNKVFTRILFKVTPETKEFVEKYVKILKINRMKKKLEELRELVEDSVKKEREILLLIEKEVEEKGEEQTKVLVETFLQNQKDKIVHQNHIINVLIGMSGFKKLN